MKPKFVRRKDRVKRSQVADAHCSTAQKSMVPTSRVEVAPLKATSPRHERTRRLQFQWSNDDDTSRDEVFEVPIGFGRGHRGGTVEDVRIRQPELDFLKLQDVREKRKRKDAAIERRKASRTRHWSDKSLVEMEDRDWRIFKEDFDIATIGGRVPLPLRSWDEASFVEVVRSNLNACGYADPTPIQRQAIPVALASRDLVAISETGSGKTCAFSVPILEFIVSKPKLTQRTASDGPYALVLAPTRELALQIERELTKLSRGLGIRIVTMIGGRQREEHTRLLRDGVEAIIATPGRLVDNLQRRHLVLNQCGYLVLDEADLMIDMGFEESLRAILNEIRCPDTRQTMMFSATMPVELERLSRQYLTDPAFVYIGNQTGSVVSTIEQRAIWTNESDKKRMIASLIRGEDSPIIIFCNTKVGCDSLASLLREEGISAVSLHGGKSQDMRTQTLQGFKEKRFHVLCASDVACRGLDIKEVTLVVNYDLPKSITTYKHRIGRTGRAGKSGKAISFVTKDDINIMYDFYRMLVEADASIPRELERHDAIRDRGKEIR